MDARYLYERGLYNQSTERIKEAKVLSKELVDQFTLLEINKEEQLSLFDRQATVQLEHIETLNVERTSTPSGHHDEELIYLDLYYRLILEVFREFNLKDASSIEELKKQLPTHPFFRPENKPVSPQAVRRFYLCNAPVGGGNGGGQGGLPASGDSVADFLEIGAFGQGLDLGAAQVGGQGGKALPDRPVAVGVFAVALGAEREDSPLPA